MICVFALKMFRACRLAIRRKGSPSEKSRSLENKSAFRRHQYEEHFRQHSQGSLCQPPSKASGERRFKADVLHLVRPRGSAVFEISELKGQKGWLVSVPLA